MGKGEIATGRTEAVGPGRDLALEIESFDGIEFSGSAALCRESLSNGIDND